MADPGEDLDLKCCHRWQRRGDPWHEIFSPQNPKSQDLQLVYPMVLLVQIGVVCLVQWAMK